MKLTPQLRRRLRDEEKPLSKHIGARVRMARNLRSMSQTDLGDALGVSFQQIQKDEKGANRIGAGRLFQISQILDVPTSFFYKGLDNVPQAKMPTLDNFQVKLVQAAAGAQTKGAQQKVLAVVRLFAKTK